MNLSQWDSDCLVLPLIDCVDDQIAAKVRAYAVELTARARLCRSCDKRFFAHHLKQHYCGPECAHEAQKRWKREWAAKHRASRGNGAGHP